MPRRPADPAARFWSKVNKDAPSGCWEWTAAINQRTGYGQFKLDGKSVQSHRYSYQLAKGPIPDGLLLLHDCDNRKCCNPDHLTPGTNVENMRDMVRKGRSARGERHHSAKLSAAQVLAIRERLAGGERVTQIAREFEVSHQVISKIKQGEVWSFLTAPLFFDPLKFKTK